MSGGLAQGEAWKSGTFKAKLCPELPGICRERGPGMGEDPLRGAELVPPGSGAKH